MEFKSQDFAIIKDLKLQETAECVWLKLKKHQSLSHLVVLKLHHL
jgi:hypothetical protein